MGIAEGAAVIEQGRALGRPSQIQVSVTGGQVTVSGSGLVVADGTILLE
jgi:trans-2,3-dihydro-3-hydroxyanthranilate isomerase